MINVSELIDDPDFCQPEPFQVRRQSGQWINNRFVTTETLIPVSGIIVPMKTKDIVQLPQGDTITGAIEIFTHCPLQTTRLGSSGEDGVIADEVTWNGEVYKIHKADDFTNYGYFYAVGVRKAGA
jgi:hypothetical protein